jgi:CRP-like cAMP-binding protein
VIPRERFAALSLFSSASNEVITTLAAMAVEMRFAPDEVMFLMGSEPRGWYVVLEGRVRVVRGSGARQHVVHTEGPGGTLGEVPVWAGGGHPATGIAAEPTVCALFSRSALESAMTTNPGVALLLLERLALRVSSLVERLDGRSARGVQARLAEFLLTRQQSVRDATISIGMTQQQLAEELGTVREVVSRELLAFRRKGLVAPHGGGRYKILDVDALRRAAE